MFLVTFHPAFAEVDAGVQSAGTFVVVDEVEAAQTSSAVLALQFPDSPLGLKRQHNNIIKFRGFAESIF